MAVIYDEKWFPGQIVNFQGQMIDVNFMNHSGKYFLWPSKKDCQTLHVDGILTTLNPPIRVSNRLFKFENIEHVNELFESFEN